MREAHEGESSRVRPRVVVIGAGFGGLAAAKRLARSDDIDTIVIDRHNHHLFQPLLYQVATAGLNATQVATPIRAEFSHYRRVEVHLGEVARIDPTARLLEAENGEKFGYDYLIVACGAQHTYSGHDEWEQFAPGLKTVEQAIEIRRRVLSAFEQAENEADPAEQRALLTFVVAGGGPTGVELSGAIADIARTVLVKDYRRIDSTSTRVVLVHSGPRVLPAFPEKLSLRTAVDLAALGVEVRTGQRVSGIDAHGVFIGDERIEARNVFWATGVAADAITRTMGAAVDHSGRVLVAPDLSIPHHSNVFVIGDGAYLEIEGRAVPGLAAAAMQEGRAAADNVLARIEGRATRAFVYRDKGIMATIGKHKAVASAGPFALTGYLAWIAWLFVHVTLLTSRRNRLSVFFDWTWSYLFSRRGARLIINRDWHSIPTRTK